MILVTGGAGYIGAHVNKLLNQKGEETVVIDSLAHGRREFVRWGRFIHTDLSSVEALKAVLKENSIEAVVHFAAHISVGESMTNPAMYLRNNVAQTLNLLEAMNSCGVKVMVFSSTAAIYGTPIKMPIPEDHPQNPVNPYGESKRFIERALYWYGVCCGLRWVALRYFNASGADPEGEIGEEHDPETHLIPLIIQAALGRAPNIEIFGTDYPTPDGTPVRDYIHVTDLAEAHWLALKYLQGGGRSAAFNLGTGQGHSVREVIAAVEQVTGRPIPSRERPRRAGDPPILVADGSKAREALGWQPRYSDLPTIIRTAVHWHQRG